MTDWPGIFRLIMLSASAPILSAPPDGRSHCLAPLSPSVRAMASQRLTQSPSHIFVISIQSRELEKWSSESYLKVVCISRFHFRPFHLVLPCGPRTLSDCR